MRCLQCKTEYVEKYGILNLSDNYIGDYEVRDVTYYECPSCGNLLFPKKTAIKISEREKEIRSELIKKLPVGEFIPTSEAAGILKISRQALHKHRRIRNGFVYYTEMAGKRLYHERSVKLFKTSGDGRFNLNIATRPTPREIFVVKNNLAFTVQETTDSHLWQKKEERGISPKYLN